APDDDTAPQEWDRLNCASAVEVPTPEPVAIDASGAWFGAPALVMRRLNGRPLHAPADLDTWLREIAQALIAVAGGPRRGVPAAVRERRPWQPPRGLRLTALTGPAVDLLQRELPKVPRRGQVFAHCDFHPGNLLWSRGRLSGVVDWSAARLAPRAWDVAYCRADLCVLLGLRAADRMLEHYERISGARLEHLPLYDLACGLSALRWSHLWAGAYAEQGRRDLTTGKVKARSAALVRRSLARL
ncbi:MAG TPA: aminoglycoside phosphotransferase family protein, partial [Actinomycetota bacterium]|nr:aminoglycoside phosphotransferase family protein [Actinomycetota bacterium]